jgi:DamX protein
MSIETMDHLEQTIRPNYWWEYFGFSQDPFQAPARHPFCYLSSATEQDLDLMQLIVRHSHEMLLIQGTKGVGKTSIVEHFLEQLEDGIPLCRMQGHPDISTDELIETLANAYDLTRETEQGASVRVQLNGILDALIQSEDRAMLVVDDAHELPVPTLQALLYLQGQRFSHQAPLAIILTIDSEFEERFQQLADAYLEKSMVKSIRLLPNELQDTEGYIEQRFTAAGLTGSLPLSREDLIHIHQWSGGVPARINNVAKQLLNDKLEHQEFDVEVSFWKEHRARIIGGVVLLALLAMLLYTWQTSEKYFNSHSITRTAETNPRTNNELATATANPGTPEVSAAAPTLPTTTVAATTAPAVANTNPVTESELSKGTIDPTQMVHEDVKPSSPLQQYAAESPMLKGDQPAAVTPPPAPETTAASTTTLGQSQQTTVTPATTVPVAEQSTNAVADEEESEPVVNQKTMASLQKAAKSVATKLAMVEPQHHTMTAKKGAAHKKITVATATISASAKHISISAYEKYLLKLPKHNFTVQIIGLHEPEKVKAYIAQNHLGAQAKFFRTRIQGKPWYVLVYGNYNNQVAATKAIKQLPKNVREQKPWIRTVASVQEVIHKNN